MTQFIRAELLARLRMLAGLSAGAFALLAVVGVSYQSLGASALGRAFHGHAPRAFDALSGSRASNPLAPHGWMAFGFNHPLFLTMSLTAAIAIGSGAIAGEVDSGRAELIFTGPVARERFLGAALVIWLAAELAILLAALAGGVIGGATSTDLRDAGLTALAWAPVQYLPLTLFVAAGALLASVMASTKGRAMGAAVGITVLGYLLNVVSGLIGSLSWLRWLSPFGYYDPGAAIDHGLQWAQALELLGAAAVLVLLALRLLSRRDLA